VKPLVMHDLTARVIFQLSWILWTAAELALALRTRRGAARDRSYRFAIASMFVGIGLGFGLARAGWALLPGSGWWPVAAGLSLFACGFALRAWAVLTLGRFFSVVVVVLDDHRVVDRGPYRFVRHPSYTGLMLLLTGLGIALGNWLSVVACTLVPLAALLYRIEVEERALVDELGDAYRVYAHGRRRLVPGVW